ncbi:YneF family protein [Alkalibacterium psychrotolerans]
MNTGLAIALILLALIGGLVGGFFIARKYMMDYFEKNPPIDENMLRMMMLQMGQKPSERKINQMMNQMKSQQKTGKKKKK